MKKLKVLMMSGMLAAGICLFAACGTANDDGTNNGVNDTSNTQVTTQENIPGTDNTTGNGTTDNNTDAGNSKSHRFWNFRHPYYCLLYHFQSYCPFPECFPV